MTDDRKPLSYPSSSEALQSDGFKKVWYWGDEDVDEILIRFRENHEGGVVHFLDNASVALCLDFETREVIGLHIEGVFIRTRREVEAGKEAK